MDNSMLGVHPAAMGGTWQALVFGFLGVRFTARRPGKWLVHCHIPHHTKNNNVEVRGGGGLTTILLVEE